MTNYEAHDWAIVLAGGSGTRLASLTQSGDGSFVPKQYCSLRGGSSLLGDAVARATRIVARDRILIVVAEEHRHFWEPELATHPQQNVLVQPTNCGTGPGLLLPLLAILKRDVAAHVAVFPSDHHVAQEHVLAETVREALDNLHREPCPIELLGIEPDDDQCDYGWMIPGVASGDTQAVSLFIEKPSPEVAKELRAQGALWNSFILTARAISLLGVYQLYLPELLRQFLNRRPHTDSVAARELYAQLEVSDFSRDVLSLATPYLRMRRLPPCGWTDLGTPERVAACLGQRANPSLLLMHSCLLAAQTLVLATCI